MESTFIILTQIITFGTAWSMFHCVLKRKKKDWFSLVGALGYLLLPYHVYVVTESVDRSQILIWMVVPILTAFGDKPDSVLYWSTGLNFELSLACGALCVVFILIGTFGCGDPTWAVWAGYRRLRRRKQRFHGRRWGRQD